MAFDFAEAKAAARRVVHDTLAVAATYQDSSIGASEDIRVRWHNRVVRDADLENSGYPEYILGINRIVLIPGDYSTITFTSGGIVTLTKDGRQFKLVAREPSDGPVHEIWQVAEL
jgi:hypothetical protein